MGTQQGQAMVAGWRQLNCGHRLAHTEVRGS